jgi:hypothetical protein
METKKRLTSELITARRLRKNGIVKMFKKTFTEKLWDYLVERFQGNVVYEEADDGLTYTIELC